MSGLSIFLFGPPRLELNGSPVDIQRRKAMAMLVYLAVTGQPHSRDALATLFYPDHSQSRARAYLRRDLAVLNTGLAGDWLNIDRETVEMKPDFWADVTHFRKSVAEPRQHDHPFEQFCSACIPPLTEAANLYTDDFLAGFTLRDCPEFDDWQFFQAESLRQELASALEQLVRGLSQQGTYETALPFARRWVALDPLHESARQQLMQLYDQAGQPVAALRQYEEFAKLLEEELGLPPEEETTTLYEAIKAKRILKPFLKARQESPPVKVQVQPEAPLAAQAEPLTPRLLPAKLGRYELLEKIGQGGFATVYRARDSELDRLVALKELKPHLLADTRWIKRFWREAKLIARLDHPRIVPLYDVGQAQGRHFIVMRLVQGPNLADLLLERGRLSWAEALEMMRAVAEGLDYAHKRGILHRDLKPANIFIDPERGSLLGDFGLAKLTGENSLSQSGEVVGTPYYIAPEVWEGQAATPQTDIYALGCVFYEILVGQKLFTGETPPTVMAAHFQPPEFPAKWPEDVSAEVTTVLARALARNPRERYATASAMVAALTRLSEGKLEDTTPLLPSSSISIERVASGSTPTPFISRGIEQQIRFCISPDGVRLAYATSGEGPPLVKAANWLSHLEFDWNSPVWRHWLTGLSEHCTLVRYDERGCGLSDWDFESFSFEAWVQDLETVVNALGVERFPLLGISQGGPVAVAYAVRHPEKVSHLILYGSYARGRLKRAHTPQQREEADLVLKLTEIGWGKNNSAFRQVFTAGFIPESTAEQMRWFNDLQRMSTSPENAVRFQQVFSEIDVRHLAPRVTAPTLVLHAREDAAVAFDEGRLLAALIPGARFVPLESKNHILLEHEPAWQRFLAEVYAFIGAEPVQAAPHPRPPAPAVAGEREQSFRKRGQERSRKPAAPEPMAVTPAGQAPHNLPTQPTPFIGREAELNQIRQLLIEEADCRLLTLVGPGGTGKTRLALAAATTVLEALPHGVFFVSLAPVQEPEFIVPAIAEALNFNFAGAAEPKDQLLTYLREKNLLLVVDNFEHLLAGAELLSEVLHAAPRITLLVTSRERLNLQEEWSNEVGGMTFPRPGEIVPGDDSAALAPYSALRLFLQRARQAKASFSLTSADMPYVVRICELVDGMPLGLELAAPWVRLMPCREIAAELERNVDILSTSIRNVPERHRSVRAIFEQTWERLLAEEQAVLSKLAVFRGGCLRQAAEAVTGATLPRLLSLVDKALLRRTSSGRYEMHELIRQFSLEQLQADPVVYEQVQDRHYAYYCSFLQQQTGALKGGRQKEALQSITADIDNVRAAWHRAIEGKDTGALEQAAESFCLYCEMRGTLYEGEVAFQQAVAAFGSIPSTVPAGASAREGLKGFLLAGQGMLRAHRGGLVEGQELLEQGLLLLRRFQAGQQHRPKEAFALLWLGWTLFLQGKNAEAEQAVQESQDLYSKVGDRWGVAKNLFVLGNSLTARGQLAESEPPLRESLAICHDIQDRRSCLLVNRNLAILTFWFGDYAQTRDLLNQATRLSQEFDDQIGLAYTLRELGKLEAAQGEYSQAIQTLQKSMAITDEIGSQWESAATLDDVGIALALTGDTVAAEWALKQCLEAAQALNNRYYTARCLGDLGWVAYHKGEYHQAEPQLQQALELWAEIGHEPYRAWVLSQLGHVAAAGQERQTAAKQYYRHALELSTRHNLAPFALEVFVGVAQLLTQVGEAETIAQLLALARHHPAGTTATKEKARRLLKELPAAQVSDPLLDWRTEAEQIIGLLST